MLTEHVYTLHDGLSFFCTPMPHATITVAIVLMLSPSACTMAITVL
jgi:hypothetical protein